MNWNILEPTFCSQTSWEFFGIFHSLPSRDVYLLICSEVWLFFWELNINIENEKKEKNDVEWNSTKHQATGENQV